MDPKMPHVDPSVNVGDLFKYSQLIGAIIAAVTSVGSLPVGGETDLPPLTTWLPDGHEYELDLHLKKKK